ncbi:hypothetical protein CDEST_00584 [Colletotrichum destructivum]|uniref:Uncharacterized protein n=1 Tax=Colletotrichum destructivum TaxID=34406 RepID=A0AAX4HXT3_9PEZI|nr:hypothetical protein CDEST_00584 [Colletotrichum destructivum]
MFVSPTSSPRVPATTTSLGADAPIPPPHPSSSPLPLPLPSIRRCRSRSTCYLPSYGSRAHSGIGFESV